MTERPLVKEVFDRVRGQAELRKDDHRRVTIGRSVRELQRALGVERRLGNPYAGNSRGDADEAVAVDRAERSWL